MAPTQEVEIDGSGRLLSSSFDNGADLAAPSPAPQDMTDQQPAAQQISPAKGRGRGKGRGRAPAKTKVKITKPQTGRGRRLKMFETIKAQAAHERLQELKSAFTSLAKLVKPALQELADRALNKLNDDPRAHDKIVEARVCLKFLDERLIETTRDFDRQLQADIDNQQTMLETRRKVEIQSFIVSIPRFPPLATARP
jgi:hypothetical protein